MADFYKNCIYGDISIGIMVMVIHCYHFTTERLFLWITFDACWYTIIIVFLYKCSIVLLLYFLGRKQAIAMVSDCTIGALITKNLVSIAMTAIQRSTILFYSTLHFIIAFLK
jgi:hypothetical protein